MLAGVMMCDSVEELVEKDWKWKATASALYQSVRHSYLGLSLHSKTTQKITECA